MLSEMQKKKLNLTFDMLDTNKNGVLERQDFILRGEQVAALRGLKAGSPKYATMIADKEADWSRLKESVKSKASHITREEWLAHYEAVLSDPKEFEKRILTQGDHLFDALDAAGKGYLGVDEVVA